MPKSGRTGRIRRKWSRQKRGAVRTRVTRPSQVSVFMQSLYAPSYFPPPDVGVQEILIWHERDREAAERYVRANWPAGWKPPIKVIDPTKAWKSGQRIVGR